MNFTRLRFGNILGIVDAYGAAHSVVTENVECHDSHFPGQTHCRWRWSFDKSVWTIDDKLTEEQYQVIERHLSKTYGLRFWANGHHDLKHFLARLARERKTRKNTDLTV